MCFTELRKYEQMINKITFIVFQNCQFQAYMTVSAPWGCLMIFKHQFYLIAGNNYWFDEAFMTLKSLCTKIKLTKKNLTLTHENIRSCTLVHFILTPMLLPNI